MESLSDAETKIAAMLWENPGITSMDLWHRCEEEFGWKKSTVFTLLRRIREKGYLKPQRSGLEMNISKEEYYHEKSRRMVRDDFNDSLTDFISSFMQGSRLSKEETLELTNLIKLCSEEGLEADGV